MGRKKRYDPNKTYRLDPSASPIMPLPPVVVAIAGLMLAIELVLQMGQRGFLGDASAIGWRIELVQNFAFYDPIFERLVQTGAFSWDALWRFVTYPFVTAYPSSLIFGTVLLLAVGTGASKTFSGLAIAVTFLVSAAVGAVVYGLLDDTNVPLIGPFPALYGFLGLFTWGLWMEARRTGGSVWRAFSLIIFLTVFQTVRWLLFGRETGIFSELAGFVAGFALAFVLARDAGQRLRRWLAMVRGG